MNAPSVKTLMQIKDVTEEKAEQIRDIIKGYAPVPCLCGRLSDPGSCDTYPYNICSYYHDGKHRYSRMRAIDALLGTYGVEHIDCGKGANSPAILYCNAGDTYATTVLKIRGRFYVGCWGDWVERGRYE